MALLEFENLPSTNTPINAENLNNNFNELASSAITVGLNGNQTLTSTEALEDLVLSETMFQKGTGLVQSGNGVKVEAGSGITAVDISGVVYLRSGYNPGDSIQVGIAKNGSIISSTYLKPQNTYAESVVIATRTIPVAEGDIITIRVLNQTTLGMLIADFNSLTFLNVKKV